MRRLTRISQPRRLLLAVDDATYARMEVYPSQKAAARLVLDRKAVPGNRIWASAYNEVAKAIAVDPNYAAASDKTLDRTRFETGKDEKKILKDLMARMAAPNPMPARHIDER
jgi:hypothetical protein